MTRPPFPLHRPPEPGDVTVLVLSHDGRHHLGPCLQALAGLRGLSGPAAILVADNASTDGTARWLAETHPDVRHVRFDANLGFAEGNDRAVAEHVDTSWVWLLNNDTAVMPDALERLCDALADGGAAAGARLVDWAGRRLDFDGGAMSWTGHGHALGHGAPVSGTGESSAPRITFFLTGAALLVHRETFLALGGFDPTYFAYYEDVDLGWRMTLAGLDPLHVPAAVVRHRGGGSGRALGGDRRARLHERNALRSLVKNYDDESLTAALPAALALAATRAGGGLALIDAAAEAMATDAETGLPLPRPDWPGWSHLAALEPDWPAWAEARSATQGLRRRSDAEVIARFGQPWAPVPPTAFGWAALRRADERFGLSARFGPRPRAGLGWRALRRLARVARISGAAGVGGAARGWWAQRRGGGR